MLGRGLSGYRYMSRKKSLMKNIFIFGLGTSLSKLLSVLLVGLYTAYIKPEDFGYYDLLVNTVAMLTPLITLQITEALFRQLLDAQETKDIHSTITSAFAVIFTGLCISTVVLFVVNSLADIRLGWILPGYIATTVLLSFSQQTARGLKRNTVYAVSGIAYTGVMLLANILLIVYGGMGVEALLLSIMIADIFGVVFIEIAVGVYRRVRPSLLSVVALKSMCRYSIPLLPNAITWWFLMVFNRYAILHFCGAEANGLFAVASKFPALLMTFFGIFWLAWQENAIVEYEALDRNEYYTKTFHMYSRLLNGAILLLLPMTRYLMGLLVDDSYQEAWKLIPFLYMGSIFQAFSNFYATIYMGAKKTAGVFVTMLVGVAGSIAVCLLLIPSIGAQAASLAHMTAFLLAWLLRSRHSRKYARVDLNLPVLLPLTALTGLYVFCYYLARPMLDIALLAAAIPVFLYLNKDLIGLILGMARDVLRKRGS